MFYKKYIFRRWPALGLVSLWCGIVPVFSADTAATSAPAQSTQPASSDPAAVGLSNHPPSLSLRDAPPVLAAAASTTPPAPAASTASTAPATPSQSVTINLINLMVKRGLLTPDDAASLIKQAEQEADTARAQAAATQATAERALATQSAPTPTPAPAPSADDEVRVTYVPDVVKQQITDEVKADVMKQTREENSVARSDTPDWVKRFRVTGDIRVRYEGQFYPSGNEVGNFTNFNAINTSASGFNVDKLSSSFVPLPQYNVDQERNRFRFRARIGADIDLGQNFTAGMRVATGSDNSPVTENQTFGGANSAQGGNFGKYAIWLDRAFIKYEMGGQPDKDLAFSIGRFDNPFFHTSMIWADDVGFDGAVVQGKYKVADGVTPFLVAGAFPVFNTDLNFSSTQSSKFRSEDKYLIAGQLGTNWTINQDFSAKVAAAYYYFENIEGKVSNPIPSAIPAAVGNTDDSRPSFAQNGNTYIALRDFEDTNPADTTANEYYGLATPFHEFAFTSQIDFSRFDPFHMALIGEFVKNLAFDRNAIIHNGAPFAPGPQNNTLSGDPNSFVGGDTGWIVRLKMGKVALEELWDWNVELNYRYVQSDATVDGFSDSDFGGALAGTNLKGYTLGANLALSPRVWTGLRWMSADSVSGPTYKNDLIQFDINAKF